MNKKGFLLAEETLKIILAVIAIAFLAYFLFALYFSNIASEKLRQSEAILSSSSESIKVIIERVRVNQNSESKNIVGPIGWYVFGFVSGSKPNSCIGKNCLCICEKVSSLSIYRLTQDNNERQINKCSDKGVCLIVEDLKTSLEKEVSKGSIDIIITYNEGIEIK